jgi:hypothetical protein
MRLAVEMLLPVGLASKSDINLNRAGIAVAAARDIEGRCILFLAREFSNVLEIIDVLGVYPPLKNSEERAKLKENECEVDVRRRGPQKFCYICPLPSGRPYLWQKLADNPNRARRPHLIKRYQQDINIQGTSDAINTATSPRHSTKHSFLTQIRSHSCLYHSGD